MASDLLLAEQELDDYSKKYVTRIKGSARDMEELIDAFLILARETDKEFEDEQTVIANVVEREIKSADIYLDNKPLLVEVDEQYPLEIFTARKVVAIVLGNLIIVKRLSNRFNWAVEVESEVDVGTRIEVFFDESKQNA